MSGAKIAGMVLPVMVVIGVLTAVPVLFNFLGLALYAAALHECSRYLFPWWPRSKIGNPAPPGFPAPREEPKYLVTKVGEAGIIVSHPSEQRRYDVDTDTAPEPRGIRRFLG